MRPNLPLLNQDFSLRNMRNIQSTLLYYCWETSIIFIQCTSLCIFQSVALKNLFLTWCIQTISIQLYFFKDEGRDIRLFLLNTNIYTVCCHEMFLQFLTPQHQNCPFTVLTFSLAGSRAIIGAEPGLNLLLAQLELLRVRQQCPAGVAESLFLAWAILTDVDGHPGCPWGVATYFRASLQITGLILLENRMVEGILYIPYLTRKYLLC